MVDVPHQSSIEALYYFTFYELVNELAYIPCFSSNPTFTSIPNGKAQRKVKMWQLGENFF